MRNNIILNGVYKTIVFKRIRKSKENIKELEKIRLDAYKISGMDPEETYYFKTLEDRKYMAYGLYYIDNDKKRLLAGCYLSKNEDRLMIEQLFVKEEFQRSDMHIGTLLLELVIQSKDEIEKVFNQEFNIIGLEDRLENSKLYEKVGFRKSKTTSYSYKAL